MKRKNHSAVRVKGTRDLFSVSMTSAKLRAMLHEAWIHGNESYNVHTEVAGKDERYAYVNKVMIDREFKENEL